MKNKFFPTFKRYIGATVKLLVLTISFFGVITLTIFGAYSAYNAVTAAYKKIKSDVMKQYAGFQENETSKKTKGTTRIIRG
ncbi:hypothetical protein KBI23_19075 [bacterium]|nr:hypothetical protein [bacterium]MBP9807646.1 hypothetical protein [bacterium]